MEFKPGSRWRSAVCDTELVVVRPPTLAVRLECGGHAVIPHAQARPNGLALSTDHADGTAAGKRFLHADSGLELLCTKAGAGSLSIDGVPIEVKEGKKLPASD